MLYPPWKFTPENRPVKPKRKAKGLRNHHGFWGGDLSVGSRSRQPRKKSGAQLTLDIQTPRTDPKTPSEEVWLDVSGYKGMYYI